MSKVFEYYKKWSLGKDKAEDFIMMLQQKATFTACNKKKVYAFDGMKTAKTLQKWLIIADDNYEKLKQINK